MSFKHAAVGITFLIISLFYTSSISKEIELAISTAFIASAPVTVHLLSSKPSTPVESRDRAIQCMTDAIYFEARNQSKKGKQAVGEVILNRVHSKKYGSTVCEVVYQKHQFTWTSKKHRKIKDRLQYKEARQIAYQLLYQNYHPIVPNATHFAKKSHSKKWFKSSKMIFVASIEDHVFFYERL